MLPSMLDRVTRGLNLSYFGVTQAEIEARRFNIFIGISLGNKKLGTQLAKEYLAFATEHTNRKVLVLIADAIDAVNWIVFRDFSDAAASKKVADKGRQFEEMFGRALRQLSHEKGQSLAGVVKIVRWNSIVEPTYRHAHDAVVQEFRNDVEFRERVMSFVDTYSARRGLKLDDARRLRQSEYVLAELPSLIQGVVVDGEQYDLALYPTLVESGMSDFVLEIQAGRWPSLAARLGTYKKNRMVEVLVEDK
jgi:tRNA-dependent cyclodipeptide synthase